MTLRLWALQSVIIRLLASSKVHPAPWFSWAWLWKEIYTQNVLIESDFNLSKSSKSAPALANSPMGYTEEIHPCIVPAVLLFDSTRGSWNSIDPKKAFARLAQQVWNARYILRGNQRHGNEFKKHGSAKSRFPSSVVRCPPPEEGPLMAIFDSGLCRLVQVCTSHSWWGRSLRATHPAVSLK